MIQHRPPLLRASFAGLTIALLILLAPALPAAPVRVVTWDLQPKDPAVMNASPQALPDAVATEATRVFKQLNPDVIVLQNVPDSAACDALIQSLRPEDYQLAVLSAFRDAQTGAVTRQQTAILSRTPASRPRWEDWRSRNSSAAPGGFASAIVRLENRDVVIYAVQLSDASNNAAWESPAQQAAREDAARQLVEQIDALGDAANGGPAVVVAGDFNTTVEDAKLSRELTLTRLERAGLSNAFGDLPAERRITLPGNGPRPDATVDYIFTRDAGRTTVVQVVPVTTTLHLPVAGDLALGTAEVAAAGGAASAATTTPAGEASDQTSFGRTLVRVVGVGNLWALAGLLAGGLICIGLGMLLLARRAASGRAGNRPGNGGLSVSSPPDAGEILIMTRSTQTGSAVQTAPATETAPVVHVQAQTWPPTGADAAEWQRRAEQAERRADRAAGALRAGLLPQLSQWLKSAFARRLISDREQLLEAQRQAALKMQVVDERLTKVEQQIQRRMREYESRITDLEQELIAAREENRELIRAKIAQVRTEMERERARLLQHAQAGS